MKKSTSLFWVFAYSKGIGSKRGDAARWGLNIDGDYTFRSNIRKLAGPLQLPFPRLRCEADRSTRTEDVPFVYQDIYVVSDRLRVLFDQHSAGDCQFLPIDICYRGKSLGLTYWIMHCLHTIDCADPELSHKMPQLPLYYVVSVVRPELVPTTVNTFRIANASCRPIVRDTLRKIIIKNRISGCTFYLP